MSIDSENDLSTNFIDRTFVASTVINLSNFSKNHTHFDALFVITKGDLGSLYVKPENVAESIDSINEDTKFVIGSQDDFLELCKTRSNVHEVQQDCIYNCLTWKRSSKGADLYNLRKTVLDEYFLSNFDIKYDRPVTIIFSDYGMGKTTYLKHVAQKVTKEDISNTVLFIDDSNLRPYLDTFDVKDLENFLNYFDIDSNKSIFYLLFDNIEHLDEFDDILKIMIQLHNNCDNLRLWITCTELETRAKLESKLGTLSCSLNPLFEEEQEEYLRQIWNDKITKSYIKDVIDLCNLPTWTSYSDGRKRDCSIPYAFCAYPLHLKIISAYFKPETKELPTKVSILDLYENFVKLNHNDIDSKISGNPSFRNICKISGFYNVNNYILAKWFSQNYKNHREEFIQIFESDSNNRVFLYFFNRLLCQNKPLHLAVLNPNFEFDILGSKLNINETDDGGRTPLHLAENINFIDLLVQNGADLTIQDDVLKWTPLEYMDNNSCLDGIDILLKHNASPDNLHKTLSLSESELAERFDCAVNDRLEHYVKFICQNCKNLKVTPKNIHDAIYLPQVLTMMVLKRAEKSKEIYKNFIGRTALFYAIEMNYPEVLRYLINDLNYDIFHRADDGETLFHVACEFGQIDTAKYLLSLGLGLNDINKNNFTAFFHGCAKNNVEILKFLIEEGIDITPNIPGLESPLQIACTYGSTDVVQYLLENAENLKLKLDINSLSCLHDAVYCSSVELTKLILSQMKININETLNGRTALHIACLRSNLDIVKMLLKAGADVNSTDLNGSTPLFELHHASNMELMELLFEHGCNILHLNERRESVLHTFLENRPFVYSSEDNQEIEFYGKVFAFLKRNGLDFNLKSSNGNTALHTALNSCNINVIKLLVQNGADVNIMNNEGELPIHLCCTSRDSVETCSYILSLGVDANIKSKLGKTPLMYSAGFPEVTRKLIDVGADIYCKDNDDRTLAHYFAEYGFICNLDILLELGFKDAKSIDCLGQTALHYAAMGDQIDCVKYLIRNFDCDLSIVDNNGKTAFDVAPNCRIKRLLEIL